MHIEREEVEKYLVAVKQAIREGRYRISPREKNEQLTNEYILSEANIEEILLALCVEDFSEAVQNEHPQYQHEVLYIFGKEVQLLPRYGDEKETVALYIKFNQLTNLFVIVVSFHKQERPLRFQFN